jgi:hypothetical protein
VAHSVGRPQSPERSEADLALSPRVGVASKTKFTEAVQRWVPRRSRTHSLSEAKPLTLPPPRPGTMPNDAHKYRRLSMRSSVMRAIDASQ